MCVFQLKANTSAFNSSLNFIIFRVKIISETLQTSCKCCANHQCPIRKSLGQGKTFRQPIASDVMPLILLALSYCVILYLLLQFFSEDSISDFFGRMGHYFKHGVEFEHVHAHSSGPVYWVYKFTISELIPTIKN